MPHEWLVELRMQGAPSELVNAVALDCRKRKGKKQRERERERDSPHERKKERDTDSRFQNKVHKPSKTGLR